MITKEDLKYLRSKVFVVGVPIVVKFKLLKKNDWAKFNATKGTEVVKWKDILKLKKMIKYDN